MAVSIIGGGLMGLSLGYFLSRRGQKVEVFEGSQTLGGLARSITLADGTHVDRFYHTILSSDHHIRRLCGELDLADRLRFRETQMGFYHNGHVHSMNNMVDFLRFPPLGWVDRFRLGLTVLCAQFVRDWRRLEGVSIEKWLLRWSGRGTYENIWRPLLRAKFDGSYADAPATYIWSRLVRMKSARAGASQKEEAGHLIGGYATLVTSLAENIVAAGGQIHLGSPVHEIAVEGGRVSRLMIDGEERPSDTVVVTVALPEFLRLISNAGREYRETLSQTQYLGIIVPLLVLDRPLTGYWALNITDDRIPFTGVIETTAYIDPQYVGGHHLVYLPKYTAPGSPWQQMSDREIQDVWLRHLEAMFPHFEPPWIREFRIHRESYAEPLHGLNQAHLIPSVRTPIQRLFLATTAQIYPALTNGESVIRHARACAQVVLEAGID